MNKFLIAAAASLTFAAPALAEDRTFSHEGIDYAYTTATQGGATVIEGTADGAKFRLVVKNGWVNGYANNVRVSFRAPKRGEGAVVVAAR